MSYRVPLDRRKGEPSVDASPDALTAVQSERPAPLRAVLLALLYPLRFFAWLTGDSK